MTCLPAGRSACGRQASNEIHLNLNSMNMFRNVKYYSDLRECNKKRCASVTYKTKCNARKWQKPHHCSDIEK